MEERRLRLSAASLTRAIVASSDASRLGRARPNDGTPLLRVSDVCSPGLVHQGSVLGFVAVGA